MVSGSRLKAWHEDLGRQAPTAGLVFAVSVGLVYANRWIVNKPALDVLVVIGSVAGVLLILIRPLWGLYTMLALMPLEGMYVVGEEVTLIRILGFVTFGAWLLHRIARREEFNLRHLFRSYGQVPLLVLFVLWAFMSGLWASDLEISLSKAMTYVQLLLFYVIIYFEINSEERLRRLIILILLAAFISAVWGIIEFDDPGLIRGEGGLRSSNALGHMLAVLSPLPLFFRRAYPTQRWIWTTVFIILVAGTYATASRAGLLVLLAALFIEIYRARLKGVLAVAALLALIVVLLPWIPTQLLSYRLEMRSLIDPYRVETLEVGVAMVTDHLVLGVGNGGFKGNYQRYLLRQSDIFFWGSPSSHITYLTILAELGIIGFTLFGSILWLGIRYLQSANGMTTANGKTRLSGLILAFRTSFIAYLISMAFVNREASKLLWVLLALCVVCYSLARQDNADASMNTAQQ